jgi:hypothetical protein
MKTICAIAVIALLLSSAQFLTSQAPTPTPAQGQAPGGRGAGQGARGRGAAAANVDGVTAGDFLIDPPTLINLGFEWFIQGDENRNAAVTVSYRKKGESVWKDALPLLRLKGERVYMASQVDVISPNMFAGSILDLEPDTAYEAQFVMSDPDGVEESRDGRSPSGRGRNPNHTKVAEFFTSILMGSQDRRSNRHSKG